MEPDNSSAILFARQPIYDYRRELAGFELLFRPAMAGQPGLPAPFDDDAATSQVLINAFTENSIEEVCSHKPAFVNFSGAMLDSDIPFAPDKLVVEVLESVEPTERIIHALGRLRQAGYRIAIDDFVLADARRELLAYADIVKLEYPAFTDQSFVDTCENLKRVYPNLTLLAEKVETQGDFDKARTAGCDLFQGYFLARPEIVRGRRLPVSRVNVLQLLAVLNNPDAGMEKIVDAIRCDPGLSVRLLKLVNSAVYYRSVTSLHMAILTLGTVRVHAYANLLALSQLEDKPFALQQIAATRGFVCQALCDGLPIAPETGFTAGLFSCLDALIDCNLDELLESIPLDAEIRRALTDYDGLLGLVLASVVAHEQGRFDEMPWTELTKLGISRRMFMSAFEKGVSLADESASHRERQLASA